MADEAASDELPSTVRAAIAARIDALPPDARAALLHASVIGQTFWRGVLDGTGELGDVDEALEALEARGLVLRRSQSQVEGDVEFAFKHVLIRDVAYGTLPRGAGASCTRAIARFLEERSTDPAELGWLLAHHWREAGEVDAARGYLLGAAERARDALAVEETYDLFSRALELATTDEDRRRIRLRRGLALGGARGLPARRQELARLIPELDGVDEIEALLARGRATLWTEQAEETFSLAGARRRPRRGARGPASWKRSRSPGSPRRTAMRGDDGDLDRAIELGDRAIGSWRPGTRLLELAEQYHMHGERLYWTGATPARSSCRGWRPTTGRARPAAPSSCCEARGWRALILPGWAGTRRRWRSVTGRSRPPGDGPRRDTS